VCEKVSVDRWAWIKLKSHGCWVWMRIPDGEPYPDSPPSGAAKRDWWSIFY